MLPRISQKASAYHGYIVRIFFSNSGLRDSLKRHMATHGDQTVQSFAASSPGLKRTARACLGCVRAKQRCVGGTPCERCRYKKTHCIFPTSAPATTRKSTFRIGHRQKMCLSPPPGTYKPYMMIQVLGGRLQEDLIRLLLMIRQ